MALFDSINQMKDAQRGTTRRRFLIGGIASVVTYFGYRLWRFRARPVTNRATKFITPIADFYTISIDEGFRPNIRLEDWQLDFAVAGNPAFSFSYDELLKRETRRVYKTFMCVGNEVGGPAMGNAEWTVTPLAPLLHQALGAAPRENLRVIFHALDGFYSSVPLDVALSEHAFIAWQMNGENLSLRHGFPARVLLPGKYGMKQPRWLSKIEIAAAPWFKGYWETRGYSDSCDIKMTARIDYAMKQSGGDWLITGVAFCGAQSVGQVEISFDEGRTWHAAKITSDKVSEAWASWEITWQPEKSGQVILSARVIDARGNRQSESNSGSFPSGSSGLHRVIVNV